MKDFKLFLLIFLLALISCGKKRENPGIVTVRLGFSAGANLPGKAILYAVNFQGHPQVHEIQ